MGLFSHFRACLLLSVLSVLLVFSPFVWGQQDKQATFFKLRIFNQTYAAKYGAFCMDGSPGGYFFRNGSITNSTKWVIWFEGGGECTNPADCLARVNTTLGSSINQPLQPGVSYTIQDDNQTVNPDFYDWNHVFLFYCSSEHWTGEVMHPLLLPSGMQYYFSGHLITVAVLQDLIGSHKLHHATEIIVTGSSAGGAGSFYHTDFIADTFPNAKVVGVPLAAWAAFGPLWTDFQNNSSATRDYFARAAIDSPLAHVWNISGVLFPDCIQAYAPNSSLTQNGTAYWFANSLCSSPIISYWWVKTPLFIGTNIFDTHQIVTANGVPTDDYMTNPLVVQYIQDFGAELTSNLSQIAKTDGCWAPSCYQHTPVPFNVPSPGQPTINGLNFQQAFHTWYFSDTLTSMKWIADYSVIWANCSTGISQDIILFPSSQTLTVTGGTSSSSTTLSSTTTEGQITSTTTSSFTSIASSSSTPTTSTTTSAITSASESSSSLPSSSHTLTTTSSLWFLFFSVLLTYLFIC